MRIPKGYAFLFTAVLLAAGAFINLVVGELLVGSVLLILAGVSVLLATSQFPFQKKV